MINTRTLVWLAGVPLALGVVACSAASEQPDAIEQPDSASSGGLASSASGGAGASANSGGGVPQNPVSSGGSVGTSTGGGGTGGNSAGTIDVLAHVLETATGALSEAAATGVPLNWDWVAGATETQTTPPSSKYTHANYWGAVFRGPSNSTPANSVISIRNCSMWFLYSGDAEWTRADSSEALGGATFTPTYGGGSAAPIVLDSFQNGINIIPAEGNIWHFWQENGYQPVPKAIREIVTNCQSRLGLRDANGTDDRSSADYLIHMGADFRNPNDPSCSNDSYICPSFGVSRFEKVKAEWRNHTFHSLTQSDIDAGTPLPPASLFALPTE